MASALGITNERVSDHWLPDNLISHRASWLSAMDRLIELEPASGLPDEDERGFWAHERQAMLDMYADLDLLQQRRASVVTPEMVEAACSQYAISRYDGAHAWPDAFSADEVRDSRENMRAAITAALSVSHETGDGEMTPKPRGFAGWKDQLEYLRRVIQDEDEGARYRAVETIDEMLEGFADVAETEAITLPAPTDETQGVKRDDVIRQTPESFSGRFVGMTPHSQGQWVDYADHLSQLEAVERERDEARAMFDECAVARDASGFLGTVPQCIEHWRMSCETAEASLTAMMEALTKLVDVSNETLGCGRRCIIESTQQDEQEYIDAYQAARAALAAGENGR